VSQLSGEAARPAASVVGIYTVEDFTWDSGKRYVGVVTAVGRTPDESLQELQRAAQARADEHLDTVRRLLAQRRVQVGAVHGMYAVLATRLVPADDGWLAYGTLSHQRW